MDIIKEIPNNVLFDCIIAAVPHNYFKSLSADYFRNIQSDEAVLIDIKGFLPRELNPIRI